MRSFLLPTRHWPIALDIGTDSVKMLQMGKCGAAVRVSACGRWQVPPSEVGAPAEIRRQMAQAIRDMHRSGGFHGRRVVTAMTCEQLAIRNIRLPHMSKRELAEAVRWEAKERFSFEVGPDQLGCLNAGQVRQGADTGDEIILLAVPAPVLDEHLALLDEAGLNPLHIDAHPVALFRGFERFLRRKIDEEAVSVLVDIGVSATRVVVARGRQVVFIKSIEIGGGKFAQAVANQLNLSYAEALELRLRVMRGDGGPGRPAEPAPARDDSASVNWTLNDSIRAEVEALAKEISLCLRYCLVTFRGLRPERVTVTGGQSYDAGIVELLGRNLNIPCVVGQPLKNIDVSGVDLGADRRGTLSEWAVCAGLALRGVDLSQALQEKDNGQHRLSA